MTMNADLRNNLWRIGGRLLLALPFCGLGLYLLCAGLGAAFFGAASIILGACIVAFPVTELFGRPLMSLYWPTAGGPAQPNFSIPEARVKQGRYEQAMTEYAAIAREHPRELRAYLGLVEVALRHLHDRQRAAAAYCQGMTHLQNKRREAVLHRMYTAWQSLEEHPRR